MRRFVIAAVAVCALVVASCATGSGDGARSPDTTSTSAAHRVSRDFSAVSPIVDRYVTEHHLNGAGLLVVGKKDGVVYEHYWGVFDAHRVSLIASASKMISAGVLLHLADEGKLDLDAPVADVVGWGKANPTITPAQLLSNSSGLVGLRPPNLYLCMWQPGGTLQDCARQIFTTPDDDADVVPPDTEFRYGGGQWQVAGAVAEKASGKSWAQLVDEIFVKPCGVPSLGYNNQYHLEVGPSYPPGFDGPASLRPTRNPSIEGGAYITPRDYAKLLLMNLRDGRCGTHRVLSGEAVARMHENRIAKAYPASTARTSPGYGMGWWVNDATGMLNDPGAYGTNVWLDLEHGYGAYLVAESSANVGLELGSQLGPPVAAAMTAG